MGDAPFEIVQSPRAPAGAADATRRWALAAPGGRPRFAGVSRTEGAAAVPVLAALPDAEREAALVQIALPLVVSDGAGPYLLDADGRITLVLAPHPALAGAYVAMGAPAPAHRLGVVERLVPPVWRWIARAEIDPSARVAALDALDACADPAAARRWAVEASG